MIKLIFQTALLIQLGTTAWAGYMPPPDDPYWCYQDCIKPNYSNHTQCVDQCYRGIYEKEQPQQTTFGAACCSWGEGIKGCMPGC